MEFYVILTVLGFVFFMNHAAPLSNKISEGKGEFGNHFEGDMVLTAAQRAAIEKAANDGIVASRNGLIFDAQHWPQKTLVYHIKDDDFDKEQIKKIHNAMSDIKNQSCIKFRERESKKEYAVNIQGLRDTCYAEVGYEGNTPKKGQVLNLGKGCFDHGTIVHEILHALGFVHMQSTYDRDDYVTIVFDNIQDGMKHNFLKYNKFTVTEYGVKYDYGSVMHYPRDAFSRNGSDTIVPKQANVTIGQRVGLSEKDVLKLNKMYKCSEN